MSINVRQSELFAGQNWEVLYRAFTQINFNASDPNTINESLRAYLRQNYQEDFSDWIASSEYVALIDLLSYLAGTLAFKTDINARENFLEVAEARESILRLARFLSYTPRRNYPARGLLKLVEIQTDDDVFDAFNVNLQNQRVIWDNPDDPDWFERTVLILNSAFNAQNPFGVPLAQGTIAGIPAQAYSLNARFGDASLGFTQNVAGTAMDFEVINTDFSSDLGFTERVPNLDDALRLIYRTDGNGNASKDTGFFVAFKQGTMRRQDINLSYPVENQIIDVNSDSINEIDVWVQTLTDSGSLWYTWDKVPAVFSDNITFNALDPALRNIFSVVTRDNDQVSLRFADGRFGNAPVGNIRVWFRTSNGLSYQIKPVDMGQVELEIPYTNRRGQTRYLTCVFALETPVSNSSPRESDDDIRRRAPQTYAAQNRMVSGEDYNTFPLSGNEARKIKSVVRVYSGHSRFIDLNDPTGTYQDVNVFSDDGIFYKERTVTYCEVPMSDQWTAPELVSLFVQPTLRASETACVVQDFLIRQVRAGVIEAPTGMTWVKASDGVAFSTGWFTTTSPYFATNATLLVEKDGVQRWLTVVSTDEDPTVPVITGLPGPVTLSEPLATGAVVKAIVPPFQSALSSSESATAQRYLTGRLSFTLWYDYAPAAGQPRWVLRPAEALETQPQVRGTQIKVFLAEAFGSTLWRFSAPGLRYQFESLKNVRFYFDGQRAVDTETHEVYEDVVRVLRFNTDPATGLGLGRNFDLKLTKRITYADGYSDPRRIGVVFADANEDGYPDDPDTYYRLVTAERENSLLFWSRTSDGPFDPCYTMVVYETQADRLADGPVVGTVAFQIDGDAPETFWAMTAAGWAPQYRAFRFGRGRGPNVAQRWVKSGGTDLAPPPTGDVVNFQWKHFAPSDRRVDPAKTNIIDIFVLTNEFDTLVRRWIANGCVPADEPVMPTELDLRLTFSEFEPFKMFSDDIVWRPVRYKYLFGATADAALRCTFKVVKISNAALTDGEIKSGILAAINQYFNADFWDFGETFYFTELAGYIHQQLATSIASIVPVPETADGAFGDGFEVQSLPNELFISTAQVADITIIDANTPNNLRIK